jgi:hypothetical protein
LQNASKVLWQYSNFPKVGVQTGVLKKKKLLSVDEFELKVRFFWEKLFFGES